MGIGRSGGDIRQVVGRWLEGEKPDAAFYRSRKSWGTPRFTQRLPRDFVVFDDELTPVQTATLNCGWEEGAGSNRDYPGHLRCGQNKRS